jgi:hypothetical protein
VNAFHAGITSVSNSKAEPSEGNITPEQSTPFQAAASPARPVVEGHYVNAADCNMVAPSEVPQEGKMETVKEELKSTVEDPGGLSAG